MPLKTLSLPFARTFGVITNNLIGLADVAAQIAAASLGGFYAAPVQTPDDYKPSEPSTITVLLSPSANSVAVATAVRLATIITTVNQLGVRTDTTFEQDVAIPNPWNTTDRLLVTLDNGAGVTFNAGTIDLQWITGIRVARNGPHANDTWPGSLLLLESLLWSYKQRCGIG